MSDPLELLRARYGAAHVPGSASRYAPDAINPVLETLLAHRSVRGFLTDALPRGTLELLIAAAQSAPSSSNLQTFSVVSLEEPERKARVATLAADQNFIREAPLFRGCIRSRRQVALACKESEGKACRRSQGGPLSRRRNAAVRRFAGEPSGLRTVARGTALRSLCRGPTLHSVPRLVPQATVLNAILPPTANTPRWLVDLSRLQHIAAAAGVEAEGLEYLDTFLMGAIDAALAAQNVVTAAESLGLGTVYVGALRNRPLEVARELGLPKGVFPLFGLAVGRPDAARPASVKPRLSQALVLHREQYSTAPIDADIESYDALVAEFNRSQNLPPTRWTERTLERVRSVSSLRGRDKLRGQLGVQGFELK